MRKYLTLLPLLLFALQGLKAQDSASFSYSFLNDHELSFTSTSALHGDYTRKAYWSFGDGIRTSSGPLATVQHYYSNSGNYNVCLRIYRYTGTDSVISGEVCRTISVQLADNCSASFTDSLASLDTGSKRFTAIPWHSNNKKPERICWNFGDGTDTCINYDALPDLHYTVNHFYSHTGSFNVCVSIVYQGGCNAHYCRTIYIGQDISCQADYRSETANNNPLTKIFVAQPWNSAQKKPLKICWNFGDGHDTCLNYNSTYTGNYNISHSFATYGQYNVCVKILYDGGCEQQKCKTETLSAPPPPPSDSCYVHIEMAATNSGNRERHFYAGVDPARSPQKICWYFGDGTDTCISIPGGSTTHSYGVVHVYQSPGSFTACTKVWYAGGCSAMKCQAVLITTTNNICGGYMTDSLTASGTFHFKGFAVLNPNDHVISWRWNFGDGTSADGPQVQHHYNAGGNYEVCLTIRSDMGCETRICKHEVFHADSPAQIGLSPNPVIGNLHIEFHSSLAETMTLSVYNASGVLVRNVTRNAIAGNNSWNLDLSSLAPGIYSLVIHSPNQLAAAIFYKQ